MMSDEERKLYNSQYYKLNKDKINKKKCEKRTCKCGSVICNASYRRHLKSTLHANNIKQMAYDQSLINAVKKSVKIKM